jgi:t-SNARE complex subunit (syntaxin)
MTTIYGDPYPNYYYTAIVQLISTYTDLVNKVQTQNENIDDETQQFAQDHSTDYKKTFYENQSIEYLQSIYIYLFYIYLFFVLIIIFILVFNQKIYNFNMLALVLLLILFPFYFYYYVFF